MLHENHEKKHDIQEEKLICLVERQIKQHAFQHPVIKTYTQQTVAQDIYIRTLKYGTQNHHLFQHLQNLHQHPSHQVPRCLPREGRRQLWEC